MSNAESPSPEVEHAFAALSSDAERGLLLTGPELRRQAGNRRNRGMAVTAGAVAVLAVGAIGAGFALAGNNKNQQVALPPATQSSSGSPSVAPTFSPSPSVTASSSSPPPSSAPTTTGPAIPKSIPARALLGPSDQGLSDYRRLDEAEPLPEFCAKAKFPSQDEAGVRASIFAVYRGPDSPEGSTPEDVLRNTVTVYRGEGAADFLGELRRAVQNCPTGKMGDLDAQFDSLGSMGLGDESVLIDRSYLARGDDGEPTNNGARNHTYIGAVRVGDSVTLLETTGYESAFADRKEVEALAKAAAKHLKSWRD